MMIRPTAFPNGPSRSNLGRLVLIVAALLPTALLLPAGAVLAQDTPATPELTEALAAETFDTVWSRIAETHFDPELGGLDWEGIRDELRPQAVSAASMPELRSVLRSMLDRLGESHFAILDGVAADALDSGGDAEPVGDADPGITLRLVEGRVLVSRLRPDAAAVQAGVGEGWEVVRVGDLPVSELTLEIQEALAAREDRDRLLPLYVPAAVEARLRGPSGTDVEVEFSDGADERHLFDLSRSEPGGSRVTFGNLGTIRVEVTSESIPLPSGGPDAGLIRLSSWFPVVVPAIAEAVDTHRQASGLIFDLRGNPGGVGGLVMGIAGHLFDESVHLGELTTRESTLRFAVNPQRVGPDGSRVTPFAGPVAILVDGLSVSTSEIFAGGLQALDRARVFGEPTPGQALPALIVSLPNGDRLMHAIADFAAPDGTRLEGRGVLPDHSAPLTRAALLEGRDPALQAALAWIEDVAQSNHPGTRTDPQGSTRPRPH